jgi:hypothetical protein
MKMQRLQANETATTDAFEMYLEVLTILLVAVAVVISLWVLPVDVLATLFVAAVVGGFAVVGVIRYAKSRHTRHSPHPRRN